MSLVGDSGAVRPGSRTSDADLDSRAQHMTVCVHLRDPSARVLQPALGDCRHIEHQEEGTNLKGPMRGVLAGLGAWKLGGGCFSTVLIFIVLFWLLGYVQC